MVLYVTLLVVRIHIAEGYLLTPLIEWRVVCLPPALTIFRQVLVGVLAGFLGLALATPLAAAALVAIKVLYRHEARSITDRSDPWRRRSDRIMGILGKGILTPSSLSAWSEYRRDHSE